MLSGTDWPADHFEVSFVHMFWLMQDGLVLTELPTSSAILQSISIEVHAHDITDRDDRKTLARAQGVLLARGKHSRSLAGER